MLRALPITLLLVLTAPGCESPRTPLSLMPGGAIHLARELDRAREVALPKSFYSSRNEWLRSYRAPDIRSTNHQLRVDATTSELIRFKQAGSSIELAALVIPVASDIGSTHTIVTSARHEREFGGRFELLHVTTRAPLSMGSNPVLTDARALGAELKAKGYEVPPKYGHSEECSLGPIRLSCFVTRTKILGDARFEQYFRLGADLEVAPRTFHYHILTMNLRQSAVIAQPISHSRRLGDESLAYSLRFPGLVDQAVFMNKHSHLESSPGIKLPTGSKLAFDITLPAGGSTKLSLRAGYLADSHFEPVTDFKGVSHPFKLQATVLCKKRPETVFEQAIPSRPDAGRGSYLVDLSQTLPGRCQGTTARISLELTGERESLIFISNPTVFHHEAGPRRPNLLLITADALRQDHTSIGGYYRNTTPRLVELARHGVSFRKHFVQQSLTQDSFPIIFSSMYRPLTVAAPPDLPRMLASHGYQTMGAISAITWGKNVPSITGFDQTFFDHSSDDPTRFRVASAWLNGMDRSRPFFLWIHLLKPHMPYSPIGAYRIFSGSGQKDAVHFGNDEKRALLKQKGKIDPEYIAGVTALYDASILQMDAEIASFMSSMHSLGFLDDTLVVVSSDHGENMDEHQQYFQHGTLQNASLHVPLVMVYPKKLPAGRRIDSITESVDLTPTILDILEIPAPAQSSFDGKSMLPIIHGDVSRMRDYAFAEFQAKIFAIQNKRWKLVYNPDLYSFEGINFAKLYTHDRLELYDLLADPKESKNVWASEPLTGELMLQKLKDLYIKKVAARSGEKPKRALTPELIRLLQRVGYLDWHEEK